MNAINKLTQSFKELSIALRRIKQTAFLEGKQKSKYHK